MWKGTGYIFVYFTIFLLYILDDTVAGFLNLFFTYGIPWKVSRTSKMKFSVKLVLIKLPLDTKRYRNIFYNKTLSLLE